MYLQFQLLRRLRQEDHVSTKFKANLSNKVRLPFQEREGGRKGGKEKGRKGGREGEEGRKEGRKEKVNINLGLFSPEISRNKGVLGTSTPATILTLAQVSQQSTCSISS